MGQVSTCLPHQQPDLQQLMVELFDASELNTAPGCVAGVLDTSTSVCLADLLRHHAHASDLFNVFDNISSCRRQHWLRQIYQ
jgi:hypothetical protein